MRVAVDAHCLGSGQGGDETMMRGLLRGLATTCSEDDRYLLYVGSGGVVPADVAGRAEFSVVRTMRRLPGAAHFPVRMPFHYYRDRRRWPADLHFGPNHHAVAGPMPGVLMIQDLTYFHLPDAYPWIHRQRFQQVAPRQARRAVAVVTVSDFCRHDIIDRLGIPAEKVFTIPNNIADPPTYTDDDRAAGVEWLSARGVSGPFALYLGNIHKRKNLARLIRAFSVAKREHASLSEHRLVVAGSSWWGGGDEEAAAAQHPEDVIFLGRVSDGEREVLMHEAEALLYVSLSEGFGLPPLEAMVRGTPAMVSNVTSLPEVVGDAALLVDPTDHADMVAGIIAVLTDEDLRKRLVGLGVPQARSWNVERTGKAAYAAFEQAIDLSRGSVPWGS